MPIATWLSLLSGSRRCARCRRAAALGAAAARQPAVPSRARLGGGSCGVRRQRLDAGLLRPCLVSRCFVSAHGRELSDAGRRAQDNGVLVQAVHEMDKNTTVTLGCAAAPAQQPTKPPRWASTDLQRTN